MRDRDDPALSFWYSEPDENDYSPDFGPVYPKKRHYTAENKVLSNETFKLSRELVDIKQKIKTLQAEEKRIKDKLVKKIPSYHWVDVNNEWIVANECYRQPTRFNRTKVLCFLKKQFNSDVSNAVASKFKPSKISFQTIFVKKNNLAESEDNCTEKEALFDKGIPDDDILF